MTPAELVGSGSRQTVFFALAANVEIALVKLAGGLIGGLSAPLR